MANLSANTLFGLWRGERDEMDIMRQRHGHIQLDEGLVNLLKRQKIEHLVRGVSRLIQIVVAESL